MLSQTSQTLSRIVCTVLVVAVTQGGAANLCLAKTMMRVVADDQETIISDEDYHVLPVLRFESRPNFRIFNMAYSEANDMTVMSDFNPYPDRAFPLPSGGRDPVVNGIRFLFFGKSEADASTSGLGIMEPLVPGFDFWQVEFRAASYFFPEPNELTVGEYFANPPYVRLIYDSEPKLKLKHNGQQLIGSSPGMMNPFDPWPTRDRFEVLEAEYGEHGRILKFAADFERVDSMGKVIVSGQLRHNSDIPIAVPEPATCSLLLAAVAGIWAGRRRS